MECMTLDQAIEHAREAGLKMSQDCSTRQCGHEHIQLAIWLQELKDFRRMYNTPYRISIDDI